MKFMHNAVKLGFKYYGQDDVYLDWHFCGTISRTPMSISQLPLHMKDHGIPLRAVYLVLLVLTLIHCHSKKFMMLTPTVICQPHSLHTYVIFGESTAHIGRRFHIWEGTGTLDHQNQTAQYPARISNKVSSLHKRLKQILRIPNLRNAEMILSLRSSHVGRVITAAANRVCMVANTMHVKLELQILTRVAWLCGRGG